jgi:hypothetical protein
MDRKNSTWLAVVVAIVVAGLAGDALAKSIELQVAGLDLVYDGTDIYDAGSVLGGNGNASEADPLTSVTVLVNGRVAGTFTGGVLADVLISDVSGIPVGGGLVTSAANRDAFGFDLVAPDDGWRLSLNLDEVDIFYVGNKVAIGGAAAASSVALQNLPFGLEMDEGEPITIAFSSAAISGATQNGSFLTGFRASGTGNINGDSMPLVVTPEPSALLLLLLGAVGLAGYRKWTAGC